MNSSSNFFLQLGSKPSPMIWITFGKYHILIVGLLIIYKSGSGSISKNIPLTPKRNVHFYLRKTKTTHTHLGREAGNYQMKKAMLHRL